MWLVVYLRESCFGSNDLISIHSLLPNRRMGQKNEFARGPHRRERQPIITPFSERNEPQLSTKSETPFITLSTVSALFVTTTRKRC